MKKEIKLALSKDKVMAELLELYPITIEETERDLFFDLVESIVSQQLSVKASDTILKRFYLLFPNSKVTPEGILTLTEDQMREVGMSRPKARYIQGIAQAVVDGLSFDKLYELSDEEVMEELTQLKGVGKWTVEMFLIFSVQRPDVFSMGDIGLRNAVSRLYGVNRDDLASIEKISNNWKPYRSYASRLLWKSLDNSPKG